MNIARNVIFPYRDIDLDVFPRVMRTSLHYGVMRTPLHYAAMNPIDDYKAVENMMNSGAYDVNCVDHGGNTPLYFAAFFHNRNVIEVLLKYGADVNFIEWRGKSTPLHGAVFSVATWNDLPEYENNLWIVKSLLQNGAHVNSRGRDNETPLMVAVRGLHLGIIKELLRWGADVHAINNEFKTCLHKAPFLDYHIYIELLKHGACTECFDKDGKTVLDIILQPREYEEPEEPEIFIKAATLVNMGRWKEFSLNEKNDRLREFMQECVEEVVRMKSIQLSKNFSLYDFVLRSDCDGYYQCVLEKSTFHSVVEILINFPIYRDFIENHFHRSNLLGELLKMKIYAICEKRQPKKKTKIYLIPDVIALICSFLPEEKDLLNFIKAYTEYTSCYRE